MIAIIFTSVGSLLPFLTEKRKRITGKWQRSLGAPADSMKTGAHLKGGLMPNSKNSPAAFAVKLSAFGSLFGALCVTFDPLTAFILALAASAVLANI